MNGLKKNILNIKVTKEPASKKVEKQEKQKNAETTKKPLNKRKFRPNP
jgi:hypothetical protein